MNSPPCSNPRGRYISRGTLSGDPCTIGLLREDFIVLFFDPDDKENRSWLRANLSAAEVRRLPFRFRRALAGQGAAVMRSA